MCKNQTLLLYHTLLILRSALFITHINPSPYNANTVMAIYAHETRILSVFHLTAPLINLFKIISTSIENGLRFTKSKYIEKRFNYKFESSHLYKL